MKISGQFSVKINTFGSANNVYQLLQERHRKIGHGFLKVSFLKIISLWSCGPCPNSLNQLALPNAPKWRAIARQGRRSSMSAELTM